VVVRRVSNRGRDATIIVMSENALHIAYDPAAPVGERNAAMREAHQSALPTSVADMSPIVEHMRRTYEEQEFNKALSNPGIIPMPSRAVKENIPGLQSVWVDDTYGNSMGEWRERWSGMSFDMMRTMVDQTPVLSSVILTRIRQVKRFCRVPDKGKGPGFQIRLRDHNADMGKDEQQSIQTLQDFITNCGWERNPRQRARLKRDNFSAFMAKQVRDSLTLDSAPIETEYKRNKALGLDGFYAIDGATIRLANEIGYQGDDEIFALQVIQGNIRAAYSYDDLIYVPRNPRTDVMVGGYGLSETELLARVVTGYLNAFTYNTKYFDSNSIPKGLLHLAGDYGQDDLNAFRRYWNAMVKGVGNAWSMPILVSKNGESKAEFEKFGVDVDDVMFAKWMTFLTSIICAIYGMAPDEINFESFTAGTSSISGSDTEEKLINSKDKGLRPLLAHFEDIMSDYIVAEFGDKYCFRWSGMDEDDAKTQWDKTTATSTVNEARAELGKDPITESWGDAPLNPTLMSAWQAEQQQNSEDYGTPGADPQDGGDDDGSGKPPGGATPASASGAAPALPNDTDDTNPADGADQDVGGDDNGSDMQKALGLPVFSIQI
jgi:hypothetical protein